MDIFKFGADLTGALNDRVDSGAEGKPAFVQRLMNQIGLRVNSALPSSTAARIPPLIEIDRIISEAQNNILNLQIDENHWDFGAHLGVHFISQYLLFTEWFGKTDSLLDRNRLKDLLLAAQLSDGSWYQVKNSSSHPGDINATIFNYWALKVCGESIHSRALSKARHFILSQGGIENAALFTKICLALFGNHSWDAIPRIPYVIFNKKAPVNYTDFSQWTIPHLMAIAYLRNNCALQSLGGKFDISELRTVPAQVVNDTTPIRHLYGQNMGLVEKILAHQQTKGSWGGYTLSTLLSMMALSHYKTNSKNLSLAEGNRIDRAIQRGFDFVEPLYFSGPEAYSGALMDGKYWDTILIGNSLLESGRSPQDLQSAAEYILAKQQKNGGFPYGDDFEYAPDVDDTAEAILFLQGFGGRYKKEIKKSVDWICEMQNSDGGWGAFDRDNEGNKLLRWMTRGFSDSVDLFDDSSADVTAHILEALGSAGYTAQNSTIVRKAIVYLKFQQEANGSWLGRWGINYIYGTGGVICGLLKVGELPSQPYIAKALDWLETRQNLDGGFGESIDSYVSPRLGLISRSTPSQTSWALLALCAAKRHRGCAAANASRYLVREFNRHGKWKDQSVVGTGHPGILYMNYPSYPYCFPLIALTSFACAVRGLDHYNQQPRNAEPIFNVHREDQLNEKRREIIQHDEIQKELAFAQPVPETLKL